MQQVNKSVLNNYFKLGSNSQHYAEIWENKNTNRQRHVETPLAGHTYNYNHRTTRLYLESCVLIYAVQAEKITAFPTLAVGKVRLYVAIHIQFIPNRFERIWLQICFVDTGVMVNSVDIFVWEIKFWFDYFSSGALKFFLLLSFL